MTDFTLTPEEKAAIAIAQGVCRRFHENPPDFANRVSMEYCARWLGNLLVLPTKPASPSPLRLGDVTVEKLAEAHWTQGNLDMRSYNEATAGTNQATALLMRAQYHFAEAAALRRLEGEDGK